MSEEFYGPEASQELHERLDREERYSVNTDDLSDDEQQAIKERMAAFDRLIQQNVNARFKVEVHFGKGRSTWKPFPGALALFLSGERLHGGGDGKIYLCPRSDCGSVIYPHERVGDKVRCRGCGKMWPQQDIIGELLYVLDPPKWATVIHRMFVKLEHNADIYLKYHTTDIRYQTAMEMARNRGGEEVNKSRLRRGLHIYPLKNIIKDTSAGAQLYDRILAFITA